MRNGLLFLFFPSTLVSVHSHEHIIVLKFFYEWSEKIVINLLACELRFFEPLQIRERKLFIRCSAQGPAQGPVLNCEEPKP